MDTRTTGVDPSASDEAKRAAEIEKEIENIRANLDGLVAELDHRRHRLSPLRLGREHPVWLTLVGGLVLAGLTTVGVLAYKKRARKQASWLAGAQRLSSTVRQVMAGKPIASAPSIGWKVLTAAGTAGAAVAGRRLARRLFWPKQG